MSYFNLALLLGIVPVLVVIYQICPKKIRPVLLLLASYGLFFYVSKWLLGFIILSSVSIYLYGLLVLRNNKKIEENKELKDKYKKINKIFFIIVLLINIALLFYFKYLKFFTINTNYLLNLFSINHQFSIKKIIAPIGISFYTLQAISYMIDINNKKVEPTKNILKVLLYLGFFPTVMEGPITRFNDVSDDLIKGERVHYKNFCFGYQRILWGLFKKLVIADRLNIMVEYIFSNYSSLGSLTIFMGAIGYTILLYSEFSGTMDVVIGIGEIFNVTLPENFKQPFFSKNISDFWTRWHISLGTWFKDYIFYPVSLSKPMKKLNSSIRKKLKNRTGPLLTGGIALFCVWSLNGLWHGAGWTFIFFGMYHFVLILLGNIFEPWIVKLCNLLKIKRDGKIYTVFRIVKTWVFIFIGEMFFKAPTLTVGFGMLKGILSFRGSSTTLLQLGLDGKDYIILVISIIALFVIGTLREKKINIREKLSNKNIFIRWAVYYLLIFAIFIFGAYGAGYVPVDPIYADF